MGYNFSSIGKGGVEEVRSKLLECLRRIREAANGQAVYGKILSVDNGNEDKLVGLINNISVNRHTAKVTLTQEHLDSEGVIIRETTQKVLDLGCLKRIEVFCTQDRRPIFIGEE